jgi:hypothetical protein
MNIIGSLKESQPKGLQENSKASERKCKQPVRMRHQACTLYGQKLPALPPKRGPLQQKGKHVEEFSGRQLNAFIGQGGPLTYKQPRQVPACGLFTDSVLTKS